MKKSKLIVSLAAVALLASCNKGNDLPLCNEGTISTTAYNIYISQANSQDDSMVAKYNIYNHMPTGLKKYRSIIDAKTTEDTKAFVPTQPADIDSSTTTMHKEINLDLEKLCYTCDYSESSTKDGVTMEMKGKFTLFFVLDEKQDEDVEEENRTGTLYELLDSDGSKFMLLKTSFEPESTDPITYGYFLNEVLQPMMFNDGSSSSPYVIYQYSNEDWVGGYFDSYNTSDPIFERNALTGLVSTDINRWTGLHYEYLEDDDEKTFCDAEYRSNNARSLSYKVNLQEHTNDIVGPDEEDTLEGGTQYVKFLDSLLTEVDENYFYNHDEFEEVKGKKYNILHESRTNYSHRNNIFGEANCTIPTDLDQYLPMPPLV